MTQREQLLHQASRMYFSYNLRLQVSLNYFGKKKEAFHKQANGFLGILRPENYLDLIDLSHIAQGHIILIIKKNKEKQNIPLHVLEENGDILIYNLY